MIENDVISILEADAILDGYLSSGSSDSRFYPVLAPQDTVAPYITFKSTVAELDENIDEDRIQLTINAGLSVALLLNIRNRIKTLLDKQDTIVIASNDYYIYYSKLTASECYVTPDTEEYIEVMFFNIKFNCKSC